VYPKYSLEQKISYWSQMLNQQMRWQSENGLDEYKIFNKEWYESIKQMEPDLDKIIAISFEKFLSWQWNYQEYLKRIK